MEVQTNGILNIKVFKQLLDTSNNNFSLYNYYCKDKFKI